MTRIKKALIFIRDYTDQGNDQFFLWCENTLINVSANQLVQEDAEIICHDYWLIAPGIFKATQKLPTTVTDLEELRISSSGRRRDRETREKIDISKSLGEFVDSEAILRYLAIFNRKAPLDEALLSIIGDGLLSCSEKIEADAKKENEWDRFVQIERPVANYLICAAATGIAINTDKLREHKEKIEFDYYMALKKFSSDYDVPLELPSDGDIISRLEPLGYDFSGVNVDYVLNFVPMRDNYAEDLLYLRKISKSRKVLAAIPLSQKRIFPIVDCFGSITSRIYFKDPSLQNLAKKHRDILTPDAGRKFSYVDYDQYEAGIMAALSGDPLLTQLYADGDLYEKVADCIFQDKNKRKEAKRLFLSYAYGMKNKHLIDAAFGYGADRRTTKDFFTQFKNFEEWKASIHLHFESNQRVGTALGNHLQRIRTGPLSEKEKRSAVSQVVQGTASLIFKKALLQLRTETNLSLKVPMHDAALFEHSETYNTQIVTEIFSNTMTEHFGGKVVGKASLSQFSPNDN